MSNEDRDLTTAEVKEWLERIPRARYEITNHLWKHYRIMPTTLIKYVPEVDFHLELDYAAGDIVKLKTGEVVLVDKTDPSDSAYPYRIVYFGDSCHRWIVAKDIDSFLSRCEYFVEEED